MLLTIAIILLQQFYHLQVRTLKAEQEARDKLSQAYDSTLEGWSTALELRDHETLGHSKRVTQLAVSVARAFGFDAEQQANMYRGALLHDIGKMGVPDSILLKPGKLTEEEWQHMRRHPQYGRNMLLPIDYLRPSLDVPSSHHEKWDGSGYPQGLKGEEIPLAARIFAIIDVWDALTSDRPYRKALSAEETWRYIESRSGIDFDPKVVAALASVLGRTKQLSLNPGAGNF
jgi:putative two-component system response regulator